MSRREDLNFVASEADLTQEEYIERPTAKLQLSERVLKDWIEKNKKNLENKRVWKTPFVAFISLAFTRVTATFKETFTIGAEIWEGICALALIGMAIWLICFWKCLPR